MNIKYTKDKFNEYLNEFSEVGEVVLIAYPIVQVRGLPSVRPYEVLLFENGEIGQVNFISDDYIGVLTFSEKPIALGTRACRTGGTLEVPVGDTLLGKSIDPLGRSLDKSNPSGIFSEYRPVEVVPKGIKDRVKITKSLETGVTVVDLIVPLGQGQRELVIGDRKTGKTNFLLQTMLTQAQKGTICVYAAIGKRKTDILQVENFFKKYNITDKSVIVGASSTDSAGIIYLAPYSAMTIAEYFRDQGKNVLIILDDLSIHAKFYREIALLSKSFPGRNSYPGDIFYTHARLIERAGNFKSMDGKSEVSISCLPVAETTEGDISGYIQTNLMSMTDGHLFFDKDLFAEGRRPAVNFFLSVTRVGRQTQNHIRSGLNRELSSFLSLHSRTQSFVHFGAELSEGVKTTLALGDKLLDFLNQATDRTLDLNLQIMLFSLIWVGTWNKKTVEQTRIALSQIIFAYTSYPQIRDLFAQYIRDDVEFNDLLGRVSKDSNQLLESVNKVVSTGNNTPGMK